MATTTIDDALAAMDAIIADARDRGDPRGYFAVLYRKVTAKVKDAINAGFFDDAERMVRLDCLFADRYIDAVAAADAGGTPTASWQLTFDAAGRWRPLVLQHLLGGINAHINLDLGIAAAACAPGEQLPGLRRDYDRVNAILAAMIAHVQRDLLQVSPWMTLLDRIGARTQSQVVRFSIVTARAGAWEFATQLANMPEDAWPAAIRDRDARVARVGNLVVHPGAWMSAGLLVVRLRESSDVQKNVATLLAADEPSWEAIAAQVAEPTLHP